LAALTVVAQEAAIISPQVQSDNRVIFRFRAPNAQKVELQLEGLTAHLPMQKDDSGVWSITSDPLEPDYYGYSFVSDGVALIDPSNPLLKPNLLSTQSMVHVPGPSSLPWEINDVPHGVLHHHFYKSGVVGDQRDYYVYTPPGYDAAAKKRKYPVLYLLHGYSDDASGWTAVGRANVILDNLIAQQKARPMIVVMTLGYGAPEIVAHGAVTLSHNDLRQRNLDKYRESLLTEVIPQVEREYRTLTDTNSRAIAGLSMGGSESLFVGLTSNRFAWIGAFSTGGLSDDLNQQLSEMKPDNLRTLKLLWIACGTDDHLFPTNQRIREWLTSKGIKHTDIDTPGAHTWMVWRRNLANFAPLLFQGK
jgi:enterochelin esterase family protein